jgi:NhaP-type Na+/H+ or K+/H+ antiporter
MSDLGLIAVVVVAYGLVSRWLERHSISAPMVFVAAGILLGPDVADLLHLELTGHAGLLLAELALVVVLFSDASRIDLGALRANESLPARLLGIGMPLTIGLGIAAGAVLLGGLEIWEVAIVATVLAPTDAALGQAVVSSKRVPQRIRQALNVESGLNDGLSVPFLALFVALAGAESDPSARDWVTFAVQQIGLGALSGLAVGLAGGWLVERAVRRKLITENFEQLTVLALAVGAWALAGELDGNGFIAAFVAGLATARITPVCGPRILDFSTREGELLNLIVFMLFGVGAISYLHAASWEVVAFGLLSLTVIRMVPVAIATLDSGLRPSSVAFLGWFGPRGLASIILALVVVDEEPELPALGVLLAAMTVTVLASVLAHGLTARPLSRGYGRRMERLAHDAPELAEVPDLPTRGHSQELDGG